MQKQYNLEIDLASVHSKKKEKQMGKIGGFLEYERQENPEVSPLERIKSFDEFHTAALTLSH